jgi:hypothetical protein
VSLFECGSKFLDWVIWLVRVKMIVLSVSVGDGVWAVRL